MVGHVPISISSGFVFRVYVNYVCFDAAIRRWLRNTLLGNIERCGFIDIGIFLFENCIRYTSRSANSSELQTTKYLCL